MKLGPAWARQKWIPPHVPRCGCSGIATTNITHPDAGIDFGRMGKIKVCDACAQRIDAEIDAELD